MKACSKCQEVKPLDDFYLQKEAPDGHRPDCKVCVKARMTAAYVEKRARLPHLWWERRYIQRARRYGIKMVLVSFTREELVATYGDACIDCGGEWTELEHVIPVSAGGEHTIENCRPICNTDNRRRWREWVASLASAT